MLYLLGRTCGLEIRDTADWKSALHLPVREACEISGQEPPGCESVWDCSCFPSSLVITPPSAVPLRQSELRPCLFPQNGGRGRPRPFYGSVLGSVAVFYFSLEMA